MAQHVMRSSVAFRFIILIGALSFFADFTYEGSRSIVGPYLATLQASGTVVGIVTGILALGAGTFAASLVTKQVFQVPFVFDPQAALLTIVGGCAVTLAMGLIGSWVALAAKPSTQLRNP